MLTPGTQEGKEEEEEEGLQEERGRSFQPTFGLLMNRRGRTSAATRRTAANWQQTDVTYEQ